MGKTLDRTVSRILAAALASLLGGCLGPRATDAPHDWQAANEAALATIERSFTDATPEGVPRSTLEAIVLLSNRERTSLASAVCVADDTLLTAAHVVDGLARDEDGRVLLRIDDVAMAPRLVDSGDPALDHQDWAVLRFDEPCFETVVELHPAALEPEWEPERGTPILLAGYAVGFFEGGTIDLDLPSPSVPATIVDARPVGEVAGCWTAVGDPLHLGGMSGGAALVWDASEPSARLFGVFCAYTTLHSDVVTTTRFLGVPVRRSVRTQTQIGYMIHRLPLAALERAGVEP